jgi:hypothetical protein
MSVEYERPGKSKTEALSEDQCLRRFVREMSAAVKFYGNGRYRQTSFRCPYGPPAAA